MSVSTILTIVFIAIALIGNFNKAKKKADSEPKAEPTPTPPDANESPISGSAFAPLFNSIYDSLEPKVTTIPEPKVTIIPEQHKQTAKPTKKQRKEHKLPEEGVATTIAHKEVDQVAEPQTDSNSADFDLRTAVISQVILERPKW
ncbi:MAG: hypothetical protein E7069_02000 [Bacteroidales bacterium]|jgi:hypothetical protein|nr:hypothetical protein [Bacteroidales bacterium]